MYIASAPADRAAGAVVEAALGRLGFRVNTVRPSGDFISRLDCDFALINLHGPLGEDGTLQALLDYAEIPYAGSGVLASAVALHKPTAKLLARGLGIDVPDGVVVRSAGELFAATPTPSPPWVVKPAVGGSSVGLAVVEDEGELDSAIRSAQGVGAEALVESYVGGRDITIGVLDVAGATLPLAAVEITTGSGAYDEDAKMRSHWRGGVRYDCPAQLDYATSDALKRQSIGLHRALGCRGYSRIDWRLGSKGQLVFLELNTNPGLSKEGNFAMSADQAGLGYDDLILSMMATAWS